MMKAVVLLGVVLLLLSAAPHAWAAGADGWKFLAMGAMGLVFWRWNKKGSRAA